MHFPLPRPSRAGTVSMTIGELDAPRAWLPWDKLDALRADCAESNGNDRIAPAPQVIAFVGEILAPGIDPPRAVRTLVAQAGTQQRVTPYAQRPTDRAVRELLDTI